MRATLGLLLSASVLGAGGATAWVQSGNFALAADLDSLQQEGEWNQRRAGALRADLERFEFAAVQKDNRARDPRPVERLEIVRR